jgi:hypothetical protein
MLSTFVLHRLRPVNAGKRRSGAAVSDNRLLAWIEDAQAGCRLKAFLFERYVAFQATPFSWAMGAKSSMSRAGHLRKFSDDENVGPA